MGFFSSSSPFDEDVEKATNEKNTTENWNLIIEICDKVGTSAENAKDCLKSITKRLNNQDPHIVLQAITLLEACVKNCGTAFLLEVASRDFEQELTKLLKQKLQPKITEKLKLLLKSWAENEFSNAPQLSLIPALYYRLKSEGMDFNIQPDPSNKPRQAAGGANIVSAQQEEDDLRKAIEMSLKESKTESRADSLSSLYPSTKQLAKPNPPPARKVRALYDFEAAEDNELTFNAGEIIHVIDDTDANWWKGQNQRGEGLFPANFVTSDLNAEPEVPQSVASNSKSSKKLAFDENVTVYSTSSNATVEIDENKIDRLIVLMHDADPEDASHDTDEMLDLEDQVNTMGPLIDTELETVDKEHAQLTQLSTQLVEAVNLYHTLMREPYHGPIAQKPTFPAGYPSHQHQQIPTSLPPMNLYNGLPAHQQYPPTSGQYQNMPGAPPPQYIGQNMHYQQHGPPQVSNSNMPMYGGMPPQYQHHPPPPTNQILPSQHHQQGGVPLQHNMPPQQIPPSHPMGPPQNHLGNPPGGPPRQLPSNQHQQHPHNLPNQLHHNQSMMTSQPLQYQGPPHNMHQQLPTMVPLPRQPMPMKPNTQQLPQL